MVMDFISHRPLRSMQRRAMNPNVQHLSISLPQHKAIWSMLPRLDRLNSLQVTMRGHSTKQQLQLVLNRATRIHVLQINYGKCSLSILFNITAKSIVGFRFELFLARSWNTEHWKAFAQSPLGRQCDIA